MAETRNRILPRQENIEKSREIIFQDLPSACQHLPSQEHHWLQHSTVHIQTQDRGGKGGNAPGGTGCVGGSGICCPETGAPVCAVSLDPG